MKEVSAVGVHSDHQTAAWDKALLAGTANPTFRVLADCAKRSDCRSIQEIADVLETVLKRLGAEEHPQLSDDLTRWCDEYAEELTKRYLSFVTFGDEKPEERPLIHEHLV